MHLTPPLKSFEPNYISANRAGKGNFHIPINEFEFYIIGSLLIRYSFSSIDMIAPSVSSVLICGNTAFRIHVILSGLALSSRNEITLGQLSPLCAISAEKSRSCVIIMACSRYANWIIAASEDVAGSLSVMRIMSYPFFFNSLTVSGEMCISAINFNSIFFIQHKRE